MKAAVLLPLTWLLAACAGAPADVRSASAESRQCFLASRVNGFTPVDRDTVRVTVGASETYELELIGSCPDVDWAFGIGIRARGSDFVCRGQDAELIVPRAGLGTPDRCPVRAVRRLSLEEARAPT